MDIKDSKEVTQRNRKSPDVEKLQKTINYATSTALKLRVAQDAAYWDLKENLQQVEGNHERLQQNMVEVQMQYEGICGQYQDELQLRPEILNKIANSREDSEVLQQHSERLKETLSRCKADQIALYNAYQRSGDIIKVVNQKQQHVEEIKRDLISRLEEQVKETHEHQNQLMFTMTSFKEQTNSELNDLKLRLDEARTQEKHLIETVNEQDGKIHQYTLDMLKKEETIDNLQKDLSKLFDEFNAQGNEATNLMQKREADLKECLESNEVLKEALANHEQYTKSVSDQNNELVEKVAVMEEEHKRAQNLITDMKQKAQDMTTTYDNLKIEMALLFEEKEKYILEFKNKEQLMHTFKEEEELLKQKLVLNNSEIEKISSELKIFVEDCENKCKRIDDLKIYIKNETNNMEQLKQTFEAYTKTTEETLNSLSTTLQSKDEELNSKDNAIKQLTLQEKNHTELTLQLETTLESFKRDMVIEREAENHKLNNMATKIQQLEASVKEKDEVVSKNIHMITEMSNDRTRLLDKIKNMQKIMDNIQKEIAKPPRTPVINVDLDDNAVMIAPSKAYMKNDIGMTRAELENLDLICNKFINTVDNDDVPNKTQEDRHPPTFVPFKRCNDVMVGSAQTPNVEEGSLQVKKSRNKERKFFKSKRFSEN